MSRIRVVIEDHTGNRKVTVEMPDDIPMGRLLPALITKLGWPTIDPAGRPVVYRLDHHRTNRRLNDNDSLQSAGVQPDDLLTLLPEMTAG